MEDFEQYKSTNSDPAPTEKQIVNAKLKKSQESEEALTEVVPQQDDIIDNEIVT